MPKATAAAGSGQPVQLLDVAAVSPARGATSAKAAGKNVEFMDLNTPVKATAGARTGSSAQTVQMMDLNTALKPVKTSRSVPAANSATPAFVDVVKSGRLRKRHLATETAENTASVEGLKETAAVSQKEEARLAPGLVVASPETKRSNPEVKAAPEPAVTETPNPNLITEIKRQTEADSSTIPALQLDVGGDAAAGDLGGDATTTVVENAASSSDSSTDTTSLMVGVVVVLVVLYIIYSYCRKGTQTAGAAGAAGSSAYSRVPQSEDDIELGRLSKVASGGTGGAGGGDATNSLWDEWEDGEHPHDAHGKGNGNGSVNSAPADASRSAPRQALSPLPVPSASAAPAPIPVLPSPPTPSRSSLGSLGTQQSNSPAPTGSGGVHRSTSGELRKRQSPPGSASNDVDLFAVSFSIFYFWNWLSLLKGMGEFVVQSIGMAAAPKFSQPAKSGNKATKPVKSALMDIRANADEGNAGSAWADDGLDDIADDE
jgi:hypothetical protein